MAKSTQRKRLQTYHAKDVGSLQHRSQLLSNTGKRLRKVVTSVSIPASHTQKPHGDDSDGPAEVIVDETMDHHADIDTSTISGADFEHPAALRIRTRAKRYQNSVS